MIYDDYIEYAKTYKEKYGDQTVVFLQVGDFFEIYAVQNDDEMVGADIYTISDICNIQVSRKNKSILENSRQNPLMAGFPLAIVSKHIQTLVGHGYTVVVIRQVTPPPNPRREVTEIVSPATHLQPQGADHRYLMVLYWEHLPVTYGATRFQWTVGMAAVDITTGDVFTAEALPRSDDRHFAKDEAYRWIQMLQPREVLVAGDVTSELLRELHLDIHHPYRKVHRVPASPKAYQKLAYQEQMFQKLYGSSAGAGGTAGMIDHLGLERSECIRIALVYAIQFIFEHNEHILKAMKLPVTLKLSNHCCVHYNALLQLNVISHTPGERPLLSLLNRCSTAFGSRMFKDRLLNPIVSKQVLENHYRSVEEWMTQPELPAIKKHFSHILDLERFSRRLLLGQLAPCEWVPIAQSLHHASLISSLLTHTNENDATDATDTIFVQKKLKKHLKSVQTLIDTHLVLEEAGKYWLNDIRGSLFREGLYPELDECQATVQSSLQRLTDLADTISSLFSGGGSAVAIATEGVCKLENNDRYGYYLSMTKKRWETVLTKEPPPSYRWKDFKAVALSSSSSVVRITHPTIDALSQTLLTDQKKLGSIASECYRCFMETVGTHVATSLDKIVAILGDMDVQMTNARNALEFCYHRPTTTIASASASATTKSFIEAKGLRHPIIERMQTQTAYVPNDVTLGTNGTDGWLLYGINASGKSSLMKAIGLNLIMAQAGMFVPCESFVFEPYDYIFTRISGADNIYRGMSSFTVEMTELRNILLRCNERSLVLGDELCAGTEALSALSIVAAGIETLATKQTSFVFATHLHELMSLNALPSNVSVFHIHIDIDEETQRITYDRHLSPGPGHSYYGLEVCRVLAMPDEFIKRAHAYRRKIQEEPDTFLNIKPSNYNASVFMDCCAICSKPATETHHILYQRDAVAKNKTKTKTKSKYKHVQHIPIHSAQNLVPLCDTCHQKEHHGELHIHGFQQTSTGRTLKVSYISEPESVPVPVPVPDSVSQ